jgi:hypothetical protein
MISSRGRQHESIFGRSYSRGRWPGRSFLGIPDIRILLPILGGIAGYLIAIALFPNNLILALVIGFGLALVLAILAYTAWSIMVTISGVILGGSLGAVIAAGLNLWNWLGWIVILVLAVVGGILVWKDP